ncbi:5-formyltetrahydrofolate cyclo-ligase [Microbacterium excoecariae]|uniref:5-formyltetrahydrofolate cyclo-ligase n=1 Tax=Microbacterium excoecariae TaxID=2715210 RepID=UPI00140D239F|nr:5-formyltetrahydrofolate cyclo-ligase [Microbacterium excoecariae]
METGEAEGKRDIRRRIRDARRALSAGAVADADRRIAARALDLAGGLGARTVACYLAAPQEPPTTGFLAAARARGIRVILPLSRPGGQLVWADDDGTSRPGPLGVPEPAGPALGGDPLAEADLILAPAAAVDVRGTRLGWGLGYYDRALAAFAAPPPVYAVIYDVEVVDALPRESHDVPMSGALTPTRTLSFDR